MQDWSDAKLLDSTRVLVDEERRITLEIVRHLREVQRRRLHARQGHPTLWDFMVKDLKYSEPAAQKRIAVMRLLDRFPEAQGLLARGKICFSTFAEIAKVAGHSKKSLPDLLRLVTGKSFRDAKRALAEELEPGEKREMLRILSGGELEIRLVLAGGDAKALERFRDLKSHERPRFRFGKHFALWVRAELEKLDPLLHADTTTSKVKNPYSFRIPKRVREEVWRRDAGTCTYVSPQAGTRCTATAFLQIDHIRPRARGGTNDPANLRLLCRAHNLLAAADEFGEEALKPGIRDPA